MGGLEAGNVDLVEGWGSSNIEGIVGAYFWILLGHFGGHFNGCKMYLKLLGYWLGWKTPVHQLTPGH